MRLFNARTFQLEEFPASPPPYAILSHTWDDEEVSYVDMVAYNRQRRHFGRPTDLLVSKKGFKKIRGCARQAIRDGLDYIWVDTCCIDKSSSAELQEAINSMFRWYQRSRVCYAYLSDLSFPDYERENFEALRRCRWFTRGWTLQELLAPGSVQFFSDDWAFIGTRFDLAKKIMAITDIADYLLCCGFSPFRRGIPSVATRMSWASKRSTTRVEDRAYSLLGLFGINMPLLYGEGEHAFTRLQEEIMKTSNDSSILAWGYFGSGTLGWRMSSLDEDDDLHSLLARSPSQYEHCQDVCLSSTRQTTVSFAMTQQGMSTTVPVAEDPICKGLLYAILACDVELTPTSRYALAIPLLPGQDRRDQEAVLGTRQFYNRTDWLRPIAVPEEFAREAVTRTICILRSEAFYRPVSILLDERVGKAYDLLAIHPPQPFPNFVSILPPRSPDWSCLPEIVHTYYMLVRHKVSKRDAIVFIKCESKFTWLSTALAVKRIHVDVRRSSRSGTQLPLEYLWDVARKANGLDMLAIYQLRDIRGAAIVSDEILKAGN